MSKASEIAFENAAARIGCEVAALKAVFEIEAAGKFFRADGSLPRRFEPHHMPRQYWAAIGFEPGTVKPWKASLGLSARKRRAMYAEAAAIDAELAARASSWGAPQIMGFNAELCGYESALQLVAEFADSADEQVRAFSRFVIARGLDSAIRAQDWYGFASGYNGTGKAAKYAAKIESAFERHSGGERSFEVIRHGSTGKSVAVLQEKLVALGRLDSADSVFGPNTERAVREFQRDTGLKVDGIVGAATWRALAAAIPLDEAKPHVQPKHEEIEGDKLVEGLAKVGAGGVVGNLVNNLGPTAELVIAVGLTAGALLVLGVWAAPRIKRALA